MKALTEKYMFLNLRFKFVKFRIQFLQHYYLFLFYLKNRIEKYAPGDHESDINITLKIYNYFFILKILQLNFIFSFNIKVS